MIEANPDAIYPRIRERFRGGAAFTAPQIDRARLAFARLSKAVRARMAGYDALLSPTTPILPPKVERLLADEDYYVSRNLLALRTTRLGNLLGLCGLTVPTPTPCAGLLITGRPFDEARLLRLGSAVEAALAA